MIVMCLLCKNLFDDRQLHTTTFEGHYHDRCYNAHRELQSALSETNIGDNYPRKTIPKESDDVNHPSHYTFGSIECIDAMEACSTREEFVSYLRLAVFKYIWRWNHKGKVKDMKKAQWYLNRMISTLEKDV